jgi:hypothetical protein
MIEHQITTSEQKIERTEIKCKFSVRQRQTRKLFGNKIFKTNKMGKTSYKEGI